MGEYVEATASNSAWGLRPHPPSFYKNNRTIHYSSGNISYSISSRSNLSFFASHLCLMISSDLIMISLTISLCVSRDDLTNVSKSILKRMSASLLDQLTYFRSFQSDICLLGPEKGIIPMVSNASQYLDRSMTFVLASKYAKHSEIRSAAGCHDSVEKTIPATLFSSLIPVTAMSKTPKE